MPNPTATACPLPLLRLLGAAAAARPLVLWGLPTCTLPGPRALRRPACTLGSTMPPAPCTATTGPAPKTPPSTCPRRRPRLLVFNGEADDTPLVEPAPSGQELSTPAVGPNLNQPAAALAQARDRAKRSQHGYDDTPGEAKMPPPLSPPALPVRPPLPSHTTPAWPSNANATQGPAWPMAAPGRPRDTVAPAHARHSTCDGEVHALQRQHPVAVRDGAEYERQEVAF